LEFEATNNIFEYEALALGLEVVKKMEITKLEVFGDFELAVQQLKKRNYHAKHPRMRA